MSVGIASSEKRIGTSKVHQLRHTFARMLEDAGAKITVIQQRLGHASAATTSIYLQALRADTDRDRVLTAQAALEYGIVDQVLGQRMANASRAGSSAA